MTPAAAAARLGVDVASLAHLDVLLCPRMTPAGREYDPGLVGYAAAVTAAVIDARARRARADVSAGEAASILGISAKRLHGLDALLRPTWVLVGAQRQRRYDRATIAAVAARLRPLGLVGGVAP